MRLVSYFTQVSFIRICFMSCVLVLYYRFVSLILTSFQGLFPRSVILHNIFIFIVLIWCLGCEIILLMWGFLLQLEIYILPCCFLCWPGSALWCEYLIPVLHSQKCYIQLVTSQPLLRLIDSQQTTKCLTIFMLPVLSACWFTILYEALSLRNFCYSSYDKVYRV